MFHKQLILFNFYNIHLPYTIAVVKIADSRGRYNGKHYCFQYLMTTVIIRFI